MPKTILVTGAAGFVGRHLLRMAADDTEHVQGGPRKGDQSGHTWIATDRAAPTRWWGCPPGMRFMAANLEDPTQTEHLISEASPSVVVHLAGRILKRPTPDNCALAFGANLMSTCNVLKGLRRVSEKHHTAVQFILASTGLVYGDQPAPFSETMEVRPLDDYGLSKLLAEQSVLAYSRDQSLLPCIFRPAVVYGPGQTGEMFIPALVAALSEGRRFSMTAGAQQRDFVFVDDMVRAFLLAIRSELVGTFNVGTGRGIPMRAVGDLAAEAFGRPDLLGLGDLPYRDREVWNYALDPARLNQVGWRAQIGLEEGMGRTIGWVSPT